MKSTKPWYGWADRPTAQESRFKDDLTAALPAVVLVSKRLAAGVALVAGVPWCRAIAVSANVGPSASGVITYLPLLCNVIMLTVSYRFTASCLVVPSDFQTLEICHRRLLVLRHWALLA